MDAHFWHSKWEKNEIAFHEPDVNPVLVKYLPELSLKQGSRIFIPLCGKTLDIAWLLSQGYRIVGAELSERAIKQLFHGLHLKPAVSVLGDIHHYCAKDIDIFVGNIFHVSKDMLGEVNAVYDRAALVALPEDMRPIYTAHIRMITQQAPQLLISYVYDQSIMPGPPFSVDEKEISRHYSGHYKIKRLDSFEISGGLKGQCPASEHVWRLTNI